MTKRETGQFYGKTNQLLQLEGLTLTDTVYTHEKVDWHYHENPYLTLILEGNLIEGNKKEVNYCNQGTLLFHHWQDPHYNIKPPGHTRGFHLELQENWLSKNDINLDPIKGSLNLKNPQLKLLMHQMFKEMKIEDNRSSLAVTSLLIELLINTSKKETINPEKLPTWVIQLRDLLNDDCRYDWSLTGLAQQLSIHPVHLSTEFPKRFHCGLGEYFRVVKMQKALSLLLVKRLSLTTIAFECGYADQSHFIRSFKAVFGITPLTYRKLI